MKAISLTQPWATLIAIGAKRIETRDWPVLHRGPLAIHAAKNLKPVGGLEGLKDLCQTPPFCDALVKAGVAFATELPLGAVVAVAHLADCVMVEPTPEMRRAFWEHQSGPHEKHFGDYSLGRYMWLLKDICPFATPIPARGMPGLWNWSEPEEVREVMRQWESEAAHG